MGRTKACLGERRNADHYAMPGETVPLLEKGIASQFHGGSKVLGKKAGGVFLKLLKFVLRIHQRVGGNGAREDLVGATAEQVRKILADDDDQFATRVRLSLFLCQRTKQEDLENFRARGFSFAHSPPQSPDILVTVEVFGFGGTQELALPKGFRCGSFAP